MCFIVVVSVVYFMFISSVEDATSTDTTDSSLEKTDENFNTYDSLPEDWFDIKIGDMIGGMKVTDMEVQDDTNLILRLAGEHVFTGSRFLEGFDPGVTPSDPKPTFIYVNDPDSFLYDSVIQITNNDTMVFDDQNMREDFSLYSFTLKEITFANHLIPMLQHNLEFVHGRAEIDSFELLSTEDVTVRETRASFDEAKLQLGDVVHDFKVVYSVPIEFQIAVRNNCGGYVCRPGEIKSHLTMKLRLKPLEVNTTLTGTLLPEQPIMGGHVDLIEIDTFPEHSELLSERRFWARHVEGEVSYVGDSYIRDTYGEGRKEFVVESFNIHPYSKGMPSSSITISNIKNLD